MVPHTFDQKLTPLPFARDQISWIGEADMPMAHITKIEDARTGQWLRHLDPVEDPIHRIDYGWTMGDWNQLDVGLETVALREFAAWGTSSCLCKWGKTADGRGYSRLALLPARQTGVNGTTGSLNNKTRSKTSGKPPVVHSHGTEGSIQPCPSPRARPHRKKRNGNISVRLKRVGMWRVI